MKVVWLCHFHNQEISKELKIRNNTNEFAPWITELIKIFEGEKEIQLYIISPHRNIKKDTYFQRNNITYYFYSIGLPFFNKYTLSIFDILTNYFNAKRKVKKYIDIIKPDIIHLHGAENAYYSASIFQFKNKYPILITIQGFLYNTLLPRTYKLRKRLAIEQRILTEFKHYGVRASFMSEELKKLNPQAHLHWHIYPIFTPAYAELLLNIEKRYDCVYFARLSKDKGIEDLLKAIKITLSEKHDISVLIIGDGEPIYMDFLSEICKSLMITNNIEWAGFVPTQEMLYELVSKASVSVLPTYYDIIPGTIIESMFLKIPVIAYNVGGIPDVNKNGEVIKLINVGDIDSLASTILELLNNDTIRMQLSEKAYARALEMFDRNSIAKDIKTAYNTILGIK